MLDNLLGFSFRLNQSISSTVSSDSSRTYRATYVQQRLDTCGVLGRLRGRSVICLCTAARIIGTHHLANRSPYICARPTSRGVYQVEVLEIGELCSDRSSDTPGPVEAKRLPTPMRASILPLFTAIGISDSRRGGDRNARFSDQKEEFVAPLALQLC